MRALSHNQLELMEAQIRLGRDQLTAVARQIDLSAAPYIIAKAGTQRTDYGLRKGFACTLKNITGNIAHHIRVVISDASTSGLYFSEEGLEVIKDMETPLPVIGPHDRKKVIQWLQEQYGQREALYRLLDETGDAFIAVFFHDLQNKVYMMKTRLIVRPHDAAQYWEMSERFDGDGQAL